MLISLKGARCFREEMTMDRLVAMETFVRVIEAGSFSGAAKQLRGGQPAVSKTIAQLEDHLGVWLLLWSTHGLTPTEAGRNFLRTRQTVDRGGRGSGTPGIRWGKLDGLDAFSFGSMPPKQPLAGTAL
jgi:hypothetical protein